MAHTFRLGGLIRIKPSSDAAPGVPTFDLPLETSIAIDDRVVAEYLVTSGSTLDITFSSAFGGFGDGACLIVLKVQTGGPIVVRLDDGDGAEIDDLLIVASESATVSRLRVSVDPDYGLDTKITAIFGSPGNPS